MLLILLLVECYTILSIGRLLTLHVFLGMLLLGPVTLKAGSVLYRFACYYTGSAPYRRKGPPAPLLRVIGPVIMLLTACVFGSGIMLVVTGPGDDEGPSGWFTVHRISFVAWAFFITIHVLAYGWRLPRLFAAEARGVSLEEGEAEGDTDGHAGASRHAGRAMHVLGGRGTRLALLIASLLAGLVIALLTVHLAGSWENPYCACPGRSRALYDFVSSTECFGVLIGIGRGRGASRSKLVAPCRGGLRAGRHSREYRHPPPASRPVLGR